VFAVAVGDRSHGTNVHFRVGRGDPVVEVRLYPGIRSLAHQLYRS